MSISVESSAAFLLPQLSVQKYLLLSGLGQENLKDAMLYWEHHLVDLQLFVNTNFCVIM